MSQESNQPPVTHPDIFNYELVDDPSVDQNQEAPWVIMKRTTAVKLSEEVELLVNYLTALEAELQTLRALG